MHQIFCFHPHGSDATCCWKCPQQQGQVYEHRLDGGILGAREACRYCMGYRRYWLVPGRAVVPAGRLPRRVPVAAQNLAPAPPWQHSSSHRVSGCAGRCSMRSPDCVAAVEWCPPIRGRGRCEEGRLVAACRCTLPQDEQLKQTGPGPCLMPLVRKACRHLAWSVQGGDEERLPSADLLTVLLCRRQVLSEPKSQPEEPPTTQPAASSSL